jgi:hypothetical protein
LLSSKPFHQQIQSEKFVEEEEGRKKERRVN